MPGSSSDASWVRAPGKLVLVGEYAVLDGAPAVVLAVDRGVRCEVRPGGAEVIILTPADDRFVRAALCGEGHEAPPGTYRFSDDHPVHLPGGAKPGFGGSAAACVAACIAGGRPANDAYAVHRAVQGGGSGVDVAASIHGGMLRFGPDEHTSLPALVPAVVWSGASAATGPRVDAFLAWGGRKAFVRQSADLAMAFPGADPVAVLAEAGRLLESMADQAGLDYLTPALARIRDLARLHGGAAKPSGAGGGDCAVALFHDPDAQAAFETACAVGGLLVIPVAMAMGAAWTAI